MKKIYNYKVIIEKDEDGTYIAKVPDIPGCYTQGKTVKEVMERIKEAIEVCLESEKENEYEPLEFVGLHDIKVSA